MLITLAPGVASIMCVEALWPIDIIDDEELFLNSFPPDDNSIGEFLDEPDGATILRNEPDRSSDDARSSSGRESTLRLAFDDKPRKCSDGVDTLSSRVGLR